jgi:hypothetical protein
MLISKPGAASMMIRMSAQVSLVPPQTSQASNLVTCHMDDFQMRATKQGTTHTALLPGTPSHPAHDEESPPHTPQLSTTALPLGTPDVMAMNSK